MSPGRETVRAAVLVAPRRIEVERLPRPSVDADAALVAVELCGICGTDLKTFAGDLPAPYPIVLGHEIVGRVAEIGERAARRYGVAAGDRVLVESSIPCWSCPACRSGAYRLCPTKGGYGTRLSVSVPPGLWGGLAELLYLAPGSIVHRLPASIGPRVAIAIPLVANGLQWVTRMGSLRPGDRVLVQGCGPQGLAAALVARAGGAAEVTVTGLTTDRGRLAFAARLGARPVVVDPDEPPDALRERVGRDFDLVLDVSGSAAAVAAAPRLLRAGGTFVLAGLVGRGATVPFATDDLVYREIRIQGVLSKDETAIRAAIALLTSDRALRTAAGRIVSHVFALEEAARAIEASRAGLDGFVKAAVAPAGG